MASIVAPTAVRVSAQHRDSPKSTGPAASVGSMRRLLRVSLVIMMVAVAAAAVRALRSQRNPLPAVPAPSPPWPPLRPVTDRGEPVLAATADAEPAPAPAPEPEPPAEPAPEPEPEPEASLDGDVEAGWMAPQPDGQCPPGYPIKAKVRSGIYHSPGQFNYDRTAPDRCYVDAVAAEADGLRPAKR